MQYNTIISEASFLCLGEKTRADPDLISEFSSFYDLANKARSNLVNKVEAITTL